MLIKKSIFTFFILCYSLTNVLAQKSGLDAIEISSLKEHLTYLSSDELQGRRFGTEVDGLNMAANYIAEKAEEMGLKPGAPNYLQQVDLVATAPDKDNFIEVKDKKGKSLYRSSSVVELTNNIGVNLQNDVPVLLAGFGDKIEDLDAEGKIVLVAQGNAEAYEKNDLRFDYRKELSKISAISKKNPVAILVVTNPNDKDNSGYQQFRARLMGERYEAPRERKASTPAVIVLPELADKLLGGKGKYKKYLGKVAKDPASVTEVTDNVMTLRTGKTSRKQDAKNVIGVIEGSDPKLKDECVVFMAHYDHLGVDENGDVYNGADDNGSGTVTIMEVAKAMASMKEKPKRSIVFLWVTGEELGMLGSAYYGDHPLFSMEKTAVCFNIDMVGRVFEERDTVWNHSPKKVKDFDGIFALINDYWPGLVPMNEKICKELNLVPDLSLPADFVRRSDQYTFHKFGVPIINYACGYHADYHKVGDEVDKINFEKMKRVVDLCYLMGIEAANEENIERVPMEP